MEEVRTKNFIEEAIEEDLARMRREHPDVTPVVKTRFPPEPNGYLHIGHAKALTIDFTMAETYGGSCNLRYDDTNPTKEDTEFVDAIEADIRWLGFSWDQLNFGSGYFDQCYELAVKLIKKGVAYVDDLTKEEMKAYRGTLTQPGKNSPWRDRTVEENLELFERMKNGEFPDGSHTLRAKIDMASPNINLRDPALYRILHVRHHQTGDKWCIYPMYDFAHPIQDALEGVTHSLCSLEYEIHRPLYNWVVEQCEFEHKPRQIEFARLNLTNTVMSKRKLRMLVEEGVVSGWDDPRMPTLCAMRRRGYPAEAIRDFLSRIGVAKADSEVETALLEACVRENLNASAHRMMAVTEPVKVVIDNWPEGQVEEVEVENLPGSEEAGKRTLHFGRELCIEKTDFMAEPPKKFFRLKPEGEVRLKGAYIVKCVGFDTDEEGNVTLIHCTYDPETRSGECQRKVKGTIHWVSVEDAVEAEFRHYEPLLTGEAPVEAAAEAVEETEGEEEYVGGAKDRDFLKTINADSLHILHGFVEKEAAKAPAGTRYQFLRMGYYCADPDTAETKPVFNKTVGLKDSFKL